MLKALKYGKVNAVSRVFKSELLSRQVYDRLLSSKSAGDIFSALKGTCYSPFLNGTSYNEITEAVVSCFKERVLKLSKWMGSGLLEEFFLRGSRIKLLKEFLESRELRPFAESYADLINVLTAVRGRLVLRLKVEDVAGELLPAGRLKRLLPHLLRADSLKDFRSVLEGITGEFSSLEELRKEIYRYHVKGVRRLLLGYPFKLSVPFAVLRLKEIELLNLRAVVEGVRFGLKRNEIEGMLIALS